jgi:hypothetical protein
MRAARMHAYEQWLILEDVGVPDIATDGVLIKGTAATMRFHQARSAPGVAGKRQR